MSILNFANGCSSYFHFLCDHISFKSIWCRPTSVRRQVSGRKGEWQRVRGRRNRKRQTENKTDWSCSGTLTSKDRDTKSRVKMSLDLILRGRRSLGNYGTNTEVGEEPLYCPKNSTAEFSWGCLVTVIWTCWAGGRPFAQVLTLEGLFLLLRYSSFQSVVHGILGEVPDAKTVFMIITTTLCWHLHWWRVGKMTGMLPWTQTHGTEL